MCSQRLLRLLPSWPQSLLRSSWLRPSIECPHHPLHPCPAQLQDPLAQQPHQVLPASRLWPMPATAATSPDSTAGTGAADASSPALHLSCNLLRCNLLLTPKHQQQARHVGHPVCAGPAPEPITLGSCWRPSVKVSHPVGPEALGLGVALDVVPEMEFPTVCACPWTICTTMAASSHSWFQILLPRTASATRRQTCLPSLLRPLRLSPPSQLFGLLEAAAWSNHAWLQESQAFPAPRKPT